MYENMYDDIVDDHSEQYDSENNEDNSILRCSARIRRELIRFPENGMEGGGGGITE